jgi:hypothetical protein
LIHANAIGFFYGAFSALGIIGRHGYLLGSGDAQSSFWGPALKAAVHDYHTRISSWLKSKKRYRSGRLNEFELECLMSDTGHGVSAKETASDLCEKHPLKDVRFADLRIHSA